MRSENYEDHHHKRVDKSTHKTDIFISQRQNILGDEEKKKNIINNHNNNQKNKKNKQVGFVICIKIASEEIKIHLLMCIFKSDKIQVSQKRLFESLFMWI